MSERDLNYYQNEQKKQADGMNAPICPDLIEDLRNIHNETPWEEGDLEEVCITVPPQHFHQAVGIGVLFDELSRFAKPGGFFVTRRSLRILQRECQIPVKILQNTEDSLTEEGEIHEY